MTVIRMCVFREQFQGMRIDGMGRQGEVIKTTKRSDRRNGDHDDDDDVCVCVCVGSGWRRKKGEKRNEGKREREQCVCVRKGLICDRDN